MATPNAPTSRSAFDDLADLFLTERDERDAAPPAYAAAPVEGSDPHARRLAPIPFPTDSSAAAAAAGQHVPRRAGRAPLVAIAVVNLPVISGPWIDQAAALLAALRGPTALLRDRGGKASLDLIAGRETREAVAAALGGSVEGFDAVIQRCRGVISQWIVEVRLCNDAPAVDLTACDELVLLTGADEAAVVAAFHQIKRLEPIPPSLRLRLIVAGSEESIAQAAAEKINQACLHSLNHGIELVGVMARMQPIPMRHLGRFEMAGRLDTTLTQALASSAAGCGESRSTATSAEAGGAPNPMWGARVALRPRTGPAHPASDAVARHPSSSPAAPQARAKAPPEASAVPGNDRASTEALRQGSSEGEWREASPAGPRPQAPMASEEPPSRSTVKGTSLIDLVAGLKAMNVDCPRAPRVEFAFDPDGGLHALAEDDSEAALQALHVACDWAREHAHLLARLNPFLASHAGGALTAPITAHLFTSRPRERRHLADGPWRIHILVRDGIESSRIAACLELN